MAKLELLQILFQKRNARQRGRTSSDQFNDMIDELGHDLASLSDQWNNRLVPLNNTLPRGTYTVPSAATSSDPDAFTDGLDGKTLFTNSRATSGTFFDSVNSRPTTVYQQFDDVYTVISNVKNDLENLITGSIPDADQIPIEDAGALYTAANVEDALAEVKTIVDSLATTSADVTKVGTPVDNQIGVWTGDGTLEGDPNLTWDGTTLTANNPGATTFIADGNIGIGAGVSSSPTANGGKVAFFGDNVSDPSMAADTAGIYAKDVTGTLEMFAVDEAGNATQISPHNPETGEWRYYSKNLKTGVTKEVNMEKLVRLVEELSGEQLLFEY